VFVNGSVELEPPADEIRSHNDFFGNVSTYYAVRAAHRNLRVTATRRVPSNAPHRRSLS